MRATSHHTARAVTGKAAVHHVNIVNTGTEYARQPPEQQPELGTDDTVVRHDLDLAQVSGYADFNQHYLHSSVNGRDYEMLCMARFLALRDFCKSNGVDVFMHLDGDIALFDATLLDVACIPHNRTAWYYAPGSTFLSTVTCHEVDAFATFLLKFYMRANRTDVVADIVKHGDTIDEYWATVIGDQVPEYAQARLSPHHISDMYLLSAFLAANDSHRAYHTMPHIYVTQHSHDNDLVALGNLRNLFPADLRPNLCQDAATFDAHVHIGETEQTYRAANGTWHKLPGAHFQGSDCKAHLVRTLGAGWGG